MSTRAGEGRSDGAILVAMEYGIAEQEREREAAGVDRYMSPTVAARCAFEALLDAGFVVIRDQPDHFVIFGPERWTVEHSVACRVSGEMPHCEYHAAIARVATEGVDTRHFGRWRITEVDSEGLPSLERADG